LLRKHVSPDFFQSDRRPLQFGSSRDKKYTRSKMSDSEEDKATLLKALAEAKWESKLNWSADLPLEFFNGVELDPVTNRVVGLFLSGFQLSGSMPESFKKLTCLSTLLMDSNKIDGAFPDEILAACEQLRTCFFAGNCMVGYAANRVDPDTFILDAWNKADGRAREAFKTNDRGRKAFHGKGTRISKQSGVVAEKLYYCTGPMDMELSEACKKGSEGAKLGDFPNLCGPASGNPCTSCMRLVGLEYKKGKASLSAWSSSSVEITVSSGSNKENAIDSNKDNYWQSSGSKPHRWEVASKAGEPLGGWRIFTKDHSSYSPKDVDIFKKTDSGSWSKVKSVTLGQKEKWTTILSEEEAGDATAFKLEITSNHSGGADSRITLLSNLNSDGKGGESQDYAVATSEEGRSLLGVSEEIAKKQKEEMEKAAKKDGTHKCKKGHPMIAIAVGSKPPGYGTPFCDECKKSRLHENGKVNYHCSTCKYDLCYGCCKKPKSSAATNPIEVGDKVKVKASVQKAQYGWGSVKHGDVGTVKTIKPNGDGYVDFPSQSSWTAKMSELEHA